MGLEGCVSCWACPLTQRVPLFSCQAPSCFILTSRSHAPAQQREAPDHLVPTSVTGVEELSCRAFCLLCPLMKGPSSRACTSSYIR